MDFVCHGFEVGPVRMTRRGCLERQRLGLERPYLLVVDPCRACPRAVRPEEVPGYRAKRWPARSYGPNPLEAVNA